KKQGSAYKCRTQSREETPSPNRAGLCIHCPECGGKKVGDFPLPACGERACPGLDPGVVRTGPNRVTGLLPVPAPLPQPVELAVLILRSRPGHHSTAVEGAVVLAVV